MQKVYIVTEGAYSSYSICSVHTTKEAALKAAAIANGTEIGPYAGAQVETWTLEDDRVAEPVTRFTYSEGPAPRRYLDVVPTMAAPCAPTPVWGFSDRYRGVVEAKTITAAKKIAAEQIAMIRAQKAGIT